jgi:hypothetical protein
MHCGNIGYRASIQSVTKLRGGIGLTARSQLEINRIPNTHHRTHFKEALV